MIENLITPIAKFIPFSKELKGRLELICAIKIYPKEMLLEDNYNFSVTGIGKD